jgi:nucleoid DNA-binding protein
MTESELVIATQKRLNAAGLGGFTPKQVRAVLRMAGAITAATLAEGDPTVLPNLGKLKTTFRPARSWRNPLAGVDTIVPARRIVSFAPTGALRKALVITGSSAGA